MGIAFGKEQPNLLAQLGDVQSTPVIRYRDNRQHCFNGVGDSSSPTADISYTLLPPSRFVASVDPRAPTNGVFRTPLQVPPRKELLLDPRSPSAGIERTPIQVIDSTSNRIPCDVLPHSLPLIHPRSPSAGIDRTPIQVPPCKELLLDPRSPSSGIKRTPIVVIDSTSKRIPCDTLSHSISLMDPRSPSAGIERTPIQVPAARPAVLVDPRSPTVGIDRTPILTFKPQVSQSAEVYSDESCMQHEDSGFQLTTTELDPRSPTVGIKRTPIVWNGVEDVPSVSQVPEYEEEVVEVEEMPLSDKIPFDISAVDIACTAPATSTMSDEVLENSVTSLESAVTVEVKSKSIQESAKQRSPGGSRSPLSPVNYTRTVVRNSSDTPRGMVQRKQVLRVEKLRGSPIKSTSRPGQYQVYCDKENAA